MLVALTLAVGARKKIEVKAGMIYQDFDHFRFGNVNGGLNRVRLRK